MTARLLSILARINASYWFFPALFSLLGFVLALVMVWLDRGVASNIVDNIDWLTAARPGGASDMLQVIAGSTIAVAATVFSITIVAVSYASGTYGPRLLTNFMEDRGNQLSLATFIGTFVYAVMVLRTVRREDEAPLLSTDAAQTAIPGFVPQLSLLVGIILMMTSIAVLVFFLNHIPASIRINTVLEDIGKRLIAQIKNRFPHEGEDADNIDIETTASVEAHISGYIEIIDFDGLESFAKKHDTRIVLDVEAGDFIHPPRALARLCEVEMTDALRREFRDCFVLSGLRTPTQDLMFLMDELVEIALRALSPGINDPFTAMTALHWIGAATAELGTRVLNESANDEKTKRSERTVVPLTHDFSEYVATGFGAARSAVATSRKAALCMFDALENCAQAVSSRTRVGVIRTEASLLLAQAENALSGPDLMEVRDRHTALTRALA